MKYKFTIDEQMPSLNQYILSERTQFRTRNGKLMTKGSQMKKQWQKKIVMYIRRDLGNLKITKPVVIHYHYVEKDMRRDGGNIHAVCQKFTEDALQDAGVLINDNRKYVVGFTADFDVDKSFPRVEVELEEVE